MKYYIVAIILCSVACLGVTIGNDDPIINDVTVTGVPVTEINSPKNLPTVTTISPNGTTPTPPVTTPTTPSSNSTTSAKPTTPTPPTPKPTTVKPNSTTSTTPASTSTKPPAPTTAPTTVTPAPAPTAAPVTTTTLSPHHDRQFDGPSFIGGIVLALGLVAIGFVAFKFYKARTELNYHTL